MPLLRIFKKQHDKQNETIDMTSEIENLLNKEIKASRYIDEVITIPLRDQYFNNITNEFKRYKEFYYTTLHNKSFDHKYWVIKIKNIRKLIEQEILIIAEALQPELKNKTHIKEVIYNPINDTIEVLFSIKIKLK